MPHKRQDNHSAANSLANSNQTSRNGITRRNALKKTALFTGSAVGAGTGTVLMGTAAANVGSCGDSNPDNYNELGYVWKIGDHKSAVDQDCSNPSYTNHKIDHASSLLYRGSANLSEDPTNPEWVHLFNTAGHVESFEQAYPNGACDGTWDHANGVNGHRVSVDNIRADTTAIDKPTSELQIGGFPEAGNGDSSVEFDDFAFTALSAAMGYYSSWAGVAAGVIGAFISSGESDSSAGQDPTLMFDWDYPSSDRPKCGSHYMQFEVEEGRKVAFSLTDEAWGLYPNYTKIYKIVSFTDPETSSSSSNVIGYKDSNASRSDNLSSNSTAQEVLRRTAPQAGEIIRTSKGESVRVDDVRANMVQQPGSPERKIQASNLPKLREESEDLSGQVYYRAFPATTMTISINGAITQ